MSENDGNSWRDLYRAALLEVDPTKLPTRLELALQSIHLQLRRSQQVSLTASEHQSLQDALQNLRVLQREKRR